MNVFLISIIIKKSQKSNQILQTKIIISSVKMSLQQLTVCEKHKKKQTNLALIPANYYICMNRYCPEAYSILCSVCKLEHRDHAVKVLNIEDVAFLIDRLLKMPLRQVGTFIIQSVDILKRLKLVNEFASKISQILKQLQFETLDFVNKTQNIVSQYAQCKNSVIQTSEAIYQFDTKQAFDQFKRVGIKKLNKIDYNHQKDRFQYGSLEIKQKQDVRRKNLTFLKRRIQEIKEYSMKIIEVILNNDESEQQQQDISKKKKHYQTLKNQIINLNINSHENDKAKENGNVKLAQQPKQKQKSKQMVIAKNESKQGCIQTDNKWIEDMDTKIKLLQMEIENLNNSKRKIEADLKNVESQLQASNIFQKKMQSDYKSKILSLQKERQSFLRDKQLYKKQKQRIQKNFQQKCEFFNHYERRLRDNFMKRTMRYKEREQLIKQLSQLIQHQRVDSRSRQTAQKQNRGASRAKKT